MKKVVENRPVLYYGTKHEDFIACHALMKTDIPVEYIGTDSLERTPILSFNYNEYQGVEKILRFIDRWKK